MKEYERLRGEAEVKLQVEIYRLRKACEEKVHDKRFIANLVASLELAQHNLTHTIVDIEVNTATSRHRYTQYLDKWNEAAKEVKEVADVLTGAVDEDGLPTPQAEEARNLRRDCAVMVWSIKT